MTSQRSFKSPFCLKGSSLCTFMLAWILTMPVLFGQYQRIADSLRPIYLADTLTGADKMLILRRLAYNEINDPDLALRYAEELIALAREEGDTNYLYLGYLHKGNSQVNQGDLDLVLEAYQMAQRMAKLGGTPVQESTALYSQGFTYARSGDFARADSCYRESIQLLRDPEVQSQPNSSKVLGEALYNYADFSLKQGNLPEAWDALQESSRLFSDIGYRRAYLYVQGSLGMYYAQKGDHQMAFQKMTQAIKELQEYRDYSAISEFQTALAEIYLKQGAFQRAHYWVNEGLENAKRLKMKDQIWRSNLLLAQIDSITGNFEEAYSHLNEHMRYKDSMNLETVDLSRFERQKAEFQVLQQSKELELNDLRHKRQQSALWVAGLTTFILILITLGGYRRYRFIRRTNTLISRERDRSEQLLLNILPEKTAQELKKHGHVRAQRFDAVTILFSDFKNFTHHAERMAPEDLVKNIDYYFSHFDTLMQKYGLEKIKTIGDAYMCAGGLPFPMKDHAERVILAAREMMSFVAASKDNLPEGLLHFEVRIGVHTGAVVAGVVGTKKFAYDIWGDAVNIAARMETASEAGKINITRDTYERVRDNFVCEYRGCMPVKNHGELDMYYVVGQHGGNKIETHTPYRQQTILKDL